MITVSETVVLPLQKVVNTMLGGNLLLVYQYFNTILLKDQWTNCTNNNIYTLKYKLYNALTSRFMSLSLSFNNNKNIFNVSVYFKVSNG